MEKNIIGIKIANNIRAERNRANITLEEISSEINVSIPTLIKYEKDATDIKISLLIELSELFKCNLKDFFMF